MGTFHCNHCGKAIFRSEDIIERINLWDLKEYQAECYAIKQAVDMESLRRYDASLHEGWYCCRFIMMRMIADKFGTGDQLLVYVDSVTEVPDGQQMKANADSAHQIKLSAVDFDHVIYQPETSGLKDQLAVVKLGAIWCPPCRLMDKVITSIQMNGGLPHVQFFEVDIDEDQALASRWNNMSIPYTLFFYNGQQIRVQSSTLTVVDGGVIGGLLEEQLMALSQLLLAEARKGNALISI